MLYLAETDFGPAPPPGLTLLKPSPVTACQNSETGEGSLMASCFLPQLDLEFCADRVILRAEGGSRNDPIPTDVHRPRKSRDRHAAPCRQDTRFRSIPRDHWLEDSERKAILEFHAKNPLEGYRRLTFMMLDADRVAASPSSVYRVLSDAGVLDRFHGKASKKGTGFVQPIAPHDQSARRAWFFVAAIGMLTSSRS
jgi:hypothetical protein